MYNEYNFIKAESSSASTIPVLSTAQSAVLALMSTVQAIYMMEFDQALRFLGPYIVLVSYLKCA